MTTQPVELEPDPRDPDVILARLPERERERFLREYEAAADAAVHEVWRFKQLRELLHVWHLRSIAYSKPDYYSRWDEIQQGGEEYVTLEQVVAEREQQAR